MKIQKELKDIPFDEMIYVAQAQGHWSKDNNEVLNKAVTSKWWDYCEKSQAESEAIGMRMADVTSMDFDSGFREPDYDVDTMDSLADESEAIDGRHAMERDKLFERVWATSLQPWKEVGPSAGLTQDTYQQLGDEYAEYYEARVQEYSNMMKETTVSRGRQVSSQLQEIYDASQSVVYDELEYE